MKRDTEIFNLIEEEHQRQLKGIELIASENFVSDQVMEAMGSYMTNKYAEGYPAKRYYGGCEVVDKSENLATIVESNKRKIDSLQNEIEDQKVKYSKEVEIGKTIYNRILNIQSIASYKEQYANCLYYRPQPKDKTQRKNGVKHH